MQTLGYHNRRAMIEMCIRDSYCKMRIILDILEELGLVDRRGDGTLSLAPASGKVDLGSSAILKNLQG